MADELPPEPPVTTPRPKTTTGTKATYGGVGAVVMTILFLLWQEFASGSSQTIPIVDKYPDIKLVLTYRNGLGEVVYKNGKKLPVEGYGLAVFSQEDFNLAKDLFGDGATAIKDSDFPIVIAYNSSAFDNTGDLMTVRRGADGELLMLSNGKVDTVRLLTSNADKTFTVHYWGNKKSEVVDVETWFRRFVHELPTKPKAKEPEKTQLDPKKDGSIKGKVIATGGNPAIIPVQAEIWVFAGKKSPADKLAKTDAFKVINSDSEGAYEAVLPAGVYTIVVPVHGKLIGNAYDQKVWPQATIELGKSLEYEFRIQKTLIEGSK